MKRKQISILLMVILLILSLSSCRFTGGKEPEEVSLLVKVPTLALNSVSHPELADSHDFLEYAAGKYMAEHENVTIRVEVFEYVYENQAITQSYGTEDAADILYEGYFNMASYISEGHVVPLDDIISDELRSDISEASWNQSMMGGRTYMMPYLSMQNILIYNKELFRDCGLEAYFGENGTIQEWTIEEWEVILDTLAEKIPDGKYPMAMYAANNQGDTHIMCFLRAFGSELFDARGNFNFEDKDAIRALKWIQDGVEKGWYPPNPENLEMSACNQLFAGGKLGIYIFNNANITLYNAENMADAYGFVNFPGGHATSFITGFEIFDNGNPEKVQTAKDFLRFIYEDEELLEISAGSIPESRKVAKKYEDQIQMLPEFMKNSVNVIDFMHSSPNWQGQDTSVRSVFWQSIHELLAGNMTPEECAAALNRDCNAAIRTDIILHD